MCQLCSIHNRLHNIIHTTNVVVARYTNNESRRRWRYTSSRFSPQACDARRIFRLLQTSNIRLNLFCELFYIYQVYLPEIAGIYFVQLCF